MPAVKREAQGNRIKEVFEALCGVFRGELSLDRPEGKGAVEWILLREAREPATGWLMRGSITRVRLREWEAQGLEGMKLYGKLTLIGSDVNSRPENRAIPLERLCSRLLETAEEVEEEVDWLAVRASGCCLQYLLLRSGSADVIVKLDEIVNGFVRERRRASCAELRVYLRAEPPRDLWARPLHQLLCRLLEVETPFSDDEPENEEIPADLHIPPVVPTVLEDRGNSAELAANQGDPTLAQRSTATDPPDSGEAPAEGGEISVGYAPQDGAGNSAPLYSSPLPIEEEEERAAPLEYSAPPGNAASEIAESPARAEPLAHVAHSLQASQSARLNARIAQVRRFLAGDGEPRSAFEFLVEYLSHPVPLDAPALQELQDLLAHIGLPGIPVARPVQGDGLSILVDLWSRLPDHREATDALRRELVGALIRQNRHLHTLEALFAFLNRDEEITLRSRALLTLYLLEELPPDALADLLRRIDPDVVIAALHAGDSARMMERITGALHHRILETCLAEWQAGGPHDALRLTLAQLVSLIARIEKD